MALVLFPLALACCKKSSPSSGAEPAPAPAPAEESIAEPTTPTRAPIAVEVVAGPTTISGAAVFDGRVLVGDGQVFCLSSFFDDEENTTVHSVDLDGCSNSEDEVAIFYNDKGKPDRETADAELGSRLDGCMEKPAFLPMARWPAKASSVQIAAWNAVATLDELGVSLTITDAGGELVVSASLSPGEKPESLHHLGETTVVRTTQSKDGHAISSCHILE